MRKIRRIILFFMVFLLAGCSSAPTSISQSHMADGAAVSDFSFSGTLKMLTQSNYQRSFTGNEAGYYGYSSLRTDRTFNLIYIDYATQKQIYLCNRVECTHSDESCTSWMQYKVSGTALLLLEDRLVLVYLGDKFMYEQYGDDALAHIDTIGLNGADRKTILRLKPATSFVNDYATDGRRLYCVQETAIQEGADIRMQRELVAIDLDTGKLTLLRKLPDNGSDKLCAAYDDRLVFSVWNFSAGSATASEIVFYEISLKNVGDEKEIARVDTSTEYAEIFDGKLFSLNLHTSALTCRDLSTGDENLILLSLLAVRQETELYFRDSSALCYVIDNWGGKIVLLLTYINPKTSESISHWYAVDQANGTVNELTLQFKSEDIFRHMDIIAETETHFLVCTEEIVTYVQVELSDGSLGDVPDTRQQLAMIKKADYWNNVPRYEPIQMIA